MENKIKIRKSLLYAAIAEAVLQKALENIRESEKFVIIQHPVEAAVLFELGVEMRDFANEYAEKAKIELQSEVMEL